MRSELRALRRYIIDWTRTHGYVNYPEPLSIALVFFRPNNAFTRDLPHPVWRHPFGETYARVSLPHHLDLCHDLRVHSCHHENFSFTLMPCSTSKHLILRVSLPFLSPPPPIPVSSCAASASSQCQIPPNPLPYSSRPTAQSCCECTILPLSASQLALIHALVLPFSLR